MLPVTRLIIGIGGRIEVNHGMIAVAWPNRSDIAKAIHKLVVTCRISRHEVKQLAIAHQIPAPVGKAPGTRPAPLPNSGVTVDIHHILNHRHLGQIAGIGWPHPPRKRRIVDAQADIARLTDIGRAHDKDLAVPAFVGDRPAQRRHLHGHGCAAACCTRVAAINLKPDLSGGDLHHPMLAVVGSRRYPLDLDN